jgi:hypothetical protein
MAYPVFRASTDGKIDRIIDAATNAPAINEHGEFLDGGGYAKDDHFVTHCRVTAINRERGLPDDAGDDHARAFLAAMSAALNRERGLPDDAYDYAIPAEHRTRPLTKSEVCRYLKVGIAFLNARISDGSMRCEQHSRQSFVFDLRDFSKSVHEKLLPKSS